MGRPRKDQEQPEGFTDEPTSGYEAPEVDAVENEPPQDTEQARKQSTAVQKRQAETLPTPTQEEADEIRRRQLGEGNYRNRATRTE